MSMAAVAVLVVRGAAAQSSGGESALPEVLYRQGRQLMAEGNVEKACAMFAESYRLDPATGTLLNLAVCHEAQNKLATAWLEFSDALTLAQRGQREDRVRFAQDRLAGLEPRLSRLTVTVAPEANIAGFETRVDGVLVGIAVRGVPAPVDPGVHEVEARAPGRKTWSERVNIDRDGMNVHVVVPALHLEVAPANASANEGASNAADSGAENPRPIPHPVYIAGGVTLALAAGAITTLTVYAVRRDTYGKVQQPAQFDQTRRWGLASDALGIGALVGAGITAYLYFARPIQAAPSAQAGRAAAVSVHPWVTVSSGGFVFEGRL
jgi:hypothetical protein